MNRTNLSVRTDFGVSGRIRVSDYWHLLVPENRVGVRVSKHDPAHRDEPAIGMNELEHAHLESIGKFWLFHPPQLSLPDAKQAIQNVSSFASAGVHNGLSPLPALVSIMAFVFLGIENANRILLSSWSEKWA